MMGSAQLDISPEEEGFAPEPIEASASAERAGAAAALRAQAAERLAAHRERRRQAAQAAATPAPQPVPARRSHAAATAAEKVAERYARTPSFRAALADEARKAMEQAAAEAEVALIKAEAVAAAQQELLAELIQYDMRVNFTPETAVVVSSEPAEPAAPVAESKPAGLTVRLYEDAGPVAAIPLTRNQQTVDLCPNEARALDEEIAFRQAPVFEDYGALLAAAIAAAQEPVAPLPANLLEFPRQLVAQKKARPRREEGPLLEEARAPQLRIFEVGPELKPLEPGPVHAGPEWGSIFLDAHTVTEPVADPDMPVPELLPSLLPPQVAPLQLRAMAAVTDATLVFAAFVAFTAAAGKLAGGFAGAGVTPLAVAAGGTLATFWLLYQVLFFSLAGQTPGMQYARIGLCTFSDENPSRSAMRKRVLAQVVAVCPLGLGVVWVLLDEDRLGWHDRISRMYQRSY